jgi:enoyl-CoA hydratase
MLADEVEGIADRLALIDPDLLSANKRITNLSMEMMGAQVLQRLAAENDARAHHAPAVRNWIKDSREYGVREALKMRDAPFGDGMAHVDVPDGRLRNSETDNDS